MRVAGHDALRVGRSREGDEIIIARIGCGSGLRLGISQRDALRDDRRASCDSSDAGSATTTTPSAPSCRVYRDAPGTIETANRPVAAALSRRTRLVPP
jgi:hypothetical protein